MSKKKKVWKDIDEVVKASSVPKKKRWIVEIMETTPKGEKASN